MANQALNNLKMIHNMQKEGSLLELLRDLRALKSQLDEMAKNLQTSKKELIAKKEAEVKATKVVEAKTEQPKEKEQVVQNSVVQKPQNEQPSFSNTKTQNNNFKRFDNKNPQQNRFQDQRRPNFANKQKPFEQNKQGPKSPKFVSTKVNNFRSFASKEPADTIVLPPERTFGNKNKNPQKKNLEEKTKPAKRTVDSRRQSVIMLNENNDFEESTMGTRKATNKLKKKQDTNVAPKVTHAIINSNDITVKDLSEKTGRPVAEIVKKLMILGVMATINSTINFETAELVASELGVTLELKLEKTMEEKLFEHQNKTPDDKSLLVKRPPIVTVMGHVDHGKTSLLDAFRKTNVVAGEAGGITQKIGAYQISFNNEKITFIDTPGHAAFTAMRARGAKSTDIAILVVAADDGIMPQTIEAINHIKAANVPVIVAINKIDKPEANIDKVKQQLAEHDLLPEEWGGSTICVPISAKTGQGLDELKSMILLVAEMEELKANPKHLATGVILEAELDKNRGPVATVLVQNGTLNVGDSFLSGLTYGKVKAMFDEHGKSIKSALPSTPVSVLGFYDVPSSGDAFYEVSESLSKQVIQERIDKIKKANALKTSGVSLDDFMDKVHEGSLKNLNLIIKTDTKGSLEALVATLAPISNEEAKVNIVHAAPGAVTESDLVLAEATKSVIIAFNIKPVAKAKQMAEKQKIEIKEYKIIYEVVDDITRAINGLLTVKYEEKYIGMAEIRVVFKLSSAGKIAGCMVKDGKVTRGCIAKVLRGNEEIGKTSVESLKIVKDEKSEVLKGYECGIKLKDNIDFKEDDTIEFYISEPIKR